MGADVLLSHKTTACRLSDNERRFLQDVIRQQTGEARLYRRARIVLLAGEGNVGQRDRPMRRDVPPSCPRVG